jgi:hypothetical protein
MWRKGSVGQLSCVERLNSAEMIVASVRDPIFASSIATPDINLFVGFNSMTFASKGNDMSNLKLHCYLLGLVTCLTFRATTLGSEPTDLGISRRISGSVPNMQRYTTASGVRFLVDFQDLTYQGDVLHTLIERDERRVTIWLGLRNFNLTIGRTAISGGPRGAECGPLRVQVGGQREFWIAYDFELQPEEPILRFNKARIRFKLPERDLTVGMPEWVEAWGAGVRRSNVASSLQASIAQSVQAIEQRFLEAAPSILEQMSTNSQIQLALVAANTDLCD